MCRRCNKTKMMNAGRWRCAQVVVSNSRVSLSTRSVARHNAGAAALFATKLCWLFRCCWCCCLSVVCFRQQCVTQTFSSPLRTVFFLHMLYVVSTHTYLHPWICTIYPQGFRILSAHVGCMHELSITSLLTFGHCYFLDSSQRVLHANIVFSWVKIAVISTHIADSWCCFDFYSLFSHSS